MTRLFSWTLVVALSVGPVGGQTQTTAEADLEQGVAHVIGGDLQGGILTLDAVIRRLTPEAAAHREELIRAYVYEGVALVGLSQEEPAKAAFREALRQDPKLRLRADKYSRQVVRVFDAAREGKAKSVMEPPSTVPKKAGTGGLGVAAILGGVALLGGGAAVAASGGSSSPTPTPAPSPTPDPRTVVTPVSSAGPVQVSFVSADPPPGSRITGCGSAATGCPRPIKIVLSFRSDVETDVTACYLELFGGAGYMFAKWWPGFPGGPGVFSLRPGEALSNQFELSYFDPSIPLPVEITRMEIDVRSRGGLQSLHKWSLSYTLAP